MQERGLEYLPGVMMTPASDKICAEYGFHLPPLIRDILQLVIPEICVGLCGRRVFLKTPLLPSLRFKTQHHQPTGYEKQRMNYMAHFSEVSRYLPYCMWELQECVSRCRWNS
jgi:hypothetical protein